MVRSRVLATYNIKGGVGKTSAAVNLATLAARDGAPTLLWDLDPQGASTYLFRVRAKVKGGGTKLVRGKSDVDSLLKGTDTEGLDLYAAVKLAVEALGHDQDPTRTLEAKDLEVGVLDRTRTLARKFKRLTTDAVAQALA